MSPPDAAGTGSSASEDVYGLLMLGSVEVALPLASLREVVPCPTHLGGLPVEANGLLGALNLRGLVIPVVDLFERESVGPLGGRIVVLVSDGERQVGLIADSIRGLASVAPESRCAMTAVDHQLVFTHAFLHPDDGRVISILDVGAILARPGIPVTWSGAAESQRGTAGASASERMLTLLRCGEITIALDVEHIRTTLAGCRPEVTVLSGGVCYGVVPYVGERVALVDPLQLLGIGRLAVDDIRAGLVLPVETGTVVIALTATVEIRSVRLDDVLPVDRSMLARSDLVEGVLDLGDGVACIVLDGSAVRCEPDLVTLGSLATSIDGAERAEADSASTARGAQSYLRYAIGAEVATPLDQILEIVPMPDQLLDTEVGPPVIGMMLHRRLAVPLVSMPAMVGLAGGAPATDGCVLIVDVDGTRVGVVIERLVEIAPLTWRDGDDPRLRTHDGVSIAGAPLITVGGSGLLAEIDLVTALRSVLAPASTPSEHEFAAHLDLDIEFADDLHLELEQYAGAD